MLDSRERTELEFFKLLGAAVGRENQELAVGPSALVIGIKTAFHRTCRRKFDSEGGAGTLVGDGIPDSTGAVVLGDDSTGVDTRLSQFSSRSAMR